MRVHATKPISMLSTLQSTRLITTLKGWRRNSRFLVLMVLSGFYMAIQSKTAGILCATGVAKKSESPCITEMQRYQAQLKHRS